MEIFRKITTGCILFTFFLTGFYACKEHGADTDDRDTTPSNGYEHHETTKANLHRIEQPEPGSVFSFGDIIADRKSVV